MQVVLTLKELLGSLINFCVPLIIIGFIAPSITRLKQNASRMLALALVLACAIKIGGYYLAEAIIYGNWVVPLTSIPGNLIQVGAAAIITLIVIEPLRLAAAHTILRK